MSDDYDKRQWQAEQAAREAALEKQREKERKARERSARNAQRKLKRLQAKLKDSGELSEWEDEFSTSVSERLETYGSAFQDLEKGRPGDALSFAQKRVVASLKAKARKKDGAPSKSGFKRGGFKRKANPNYTPRVRHIEDDMPEATPDEELAEQLAEKPAEKDAAFIPEYSPDTQQAGRAKRPFLRLVQTDKE